MLVMKIQPHERVMLEFPGGVTMWISWQFDSRGQVRLCFDGPKDEIRVVREKILDREVPHEGR